MNCHIMVFAGTGAVTIIPYEIGRLHGINELILIGHGMNLPVSGCIAVLTTVYAFLISFISWLESRILR